MENEQRFEKIINKFEPAINAISRMDMWLPQAIDHAINGHRGTLDGVDIDKMRREKKEDEKRDAEINSLCDQIEESRKQTKEIAQQTEYLFYTVLMAIIGLMINIFLQIK